MQNASHIKIEPMLPVGDKPFWDQDYSEEEEQRVKSIPESFVLLKSLKQSRDRWLFQTFPKFSTKTRGSKAPEVTQPPHTIQTRGRCNLEIGPHLFPDTVFYEVHYLSSQVPYSPPAPVQNTPSNPYWQSTMAYNSTYHQYSTPATQGTQPTNSTAITATASTGTTTPSLAEPDRVPTPLISSLTPVAAITPGLINQVNAAASANPILSNLLQLAAAGKATPDQLKTLGLLIQSLANMETASAAALAAATAPQQQPPTQSTGGTVDYYQRMPTQAPVKPFDLVLEFRETPGDRWVFPRGSVSAERISNPNASIGKIDVLVTTCLSNDGKVSVSLSEQTISDTSSGSSGLYPASLRLKDAPPAIWDTIFRWIGGEEKNSLHKKQIESLIQPKRLYLGLQLPSGSLLTQLQNACGPSYTMKPLRQGPAPQSRASRQRKPYTEKKTTTSRTLSGDSIVVKKPRASQTKSSAIPIQCVSCKQTDVPLILGGRYCRPCVDSGKWAPSVPPPTPPVQTAHTTS